MPYITKQNQAITADRNWLISKQYDARWSPSRRHGRHHAVRNNVDTLKQRVPGHMTRIA